jgi:hypothetical protein
MKFIGLFVSYGLAKNSSLSPTGPESAEVQAGHLCTRMTLMGMYVLVNGW